MRIKYFNRSLKKDYEGINDHALGRNGNTLYVQKGLGKKRTIEVIKHEFVESKLLKDNPFYVAHSIALDEQSRSWKNIRKDLKNRRY